GSGRPHVRGDTQWDPADPDGRRLGEVEMDFIGDGVRAIVVLGDDNWVIDLRRLDIDASGRRVFHWSLFERGRYVYGDDNLRGPVGVVDVTAREMVGVLVEFLLADAEKFGSAESLMEFTTTERVAEFAYAR